MVVSVVDFFKKSRADKFREKVKKSENISIRNLNKNVLFRVRLKKN